MLTTKELEALRATDDGRSLTDGGSLRGIIRAKNDGNVSVNFRWYFKLGGKLNTIRIGTWPAMSLADIRKVRNELRATVDKGINPLEHREAQRQADQSQAEAERLKTLADQAEAIRVQQQRLTQIAALEARQTVFDGIDKWISTSLSGRRDKGSETRRSFEKDVIPHIGDLAIADVQRKHIAEILDIIKARATGDQTMVKSSKKTLADLRQFFGWCVDRELIDRDPTERISKAGLGADVERDRVMNDAELIDLMRKLPVSGLTEATQCALLIQLSTASRIGELLAARWSDVDVNQRIWRIPATTAKNGKSHEVYLSDFAMAQFQHLNSLTGIFEWLFPNSRLGKDGKPTNHIDLKTITKQTADRQRTAEQALTGRTKQTTALVLAGGRWKPHDLRRTAATMMAELGALPDVIERCLNHVEPSKVRRIYQRATYAVPMREAWRILGERLGLLQSRANGKLPT